jgi:hypothetical protein
MSGSPGANNNNNNSTANNNEQQSGQNANSNTGKFASASLSAQFSSKNFSTADNFASSLLSAFGLATAAAPPPSTTNQSTNNTNTTTTNTTASAGSNNQNQQGQLHRSRISQLFVPISMNRSRRLIIRRSSG